MAPSPHVSYPRGCWLGPCRAPRDQRGFSRRGQYRAVLARREKPHGPIGARQGPSQHPRGYEKCVLATALRVYPHQAPGRAPCGRHAARSCARSASPARRFRPWRAKRPTPGPTPGPTSPKPQVPGSPRYPGMHAGRAVPPMITAGAPTAWVTPVWRPSSLFSPRIPPWPTLVETLFADMRRCIFIGRDDRCRERRRLLLHVSRGARLAKSVFQPTARHRVVGEPTRGIDVELRQ